MAKETIELIRESEIKVLRMENDAHAEADRIKERSKAKAEEIIKSAKIKAEDIIKIKKAETEAELSRVRDEENKSIEKSLKQLEQEVKAKEAAAVNTVISIISGE